MNQQVETPAAAGASPPGAAPPQLAVLMMLESGYAWDEIERVLGADHAVIMRHLDGYRAACLRRLAGTAHEPGR